MQAVQHNGHDHGAPAEDHPPEQGHEDHGGGSGGARAEHHAPEKEAPGHDHDHGHGHGHGSADRAEGGPKEDHGGQVLDPHEPAQPHADAAEPTEKAASAASTAAPEGFAQAAPPAAPAPAAPAPPAAGALAGRYRLRGLRRPGKRRVRQRYGGIGAQRIDRRGDPGGGRRTAASCARARGRAGRAARGCGRRAARGTRRRRPLSRRRRAEAAGRGVDGLTGPGCRNPARATGDGGPGRVAAVEHQLRPRGFDRVLPDADVDLGSGGVRRLRPGP